MHTASSRFRWKYLSSFDFQKIFEKCNRRKRVPMLDTTEREIHLFGVGL